jgi:hypothetical protein
LVYADCVNILGGSVHTIKKPKAFVVARKQTELKVTAGKTNYTVMSRDQNAGRSHRIKIFFERVEEFKYLGTTLTKKSIQEEIQKRMKPGNACYHQFAIENVKIWTCRNIILLVLCVGVKRIHTHIGRNVG